MTIHRYIKILNGDLTEAQNDLTKVNLTNLGRSTMMARGAPMQRISDIKTSIAIAGSSVSA